MYRRNSCAVPDTSFHRPNSALNVPRRFSLDLASQPCFPSLSSSSPTNKIRANKDLRISTPSNKLTKIQVGAVRRELRTRVTRMAKHLITAERHQLKLMNYTEKVSRFQLRKNKQELARLHRAWLVLACMYVSGNVVNQAIAARYEAHAKVEELLQWCSQIFRVIGKMRIWLRAVRKKRSLRAMNWSRARRLKHLTTVTHVVEKALTYTQMHSLMYTFMAKVTFIKIVQAQRHLRATLPIKRHFYENTLQEWVTIELELAKNANKRRSRGKGTANNKVEAIVPEQLKPVYIREFLRERLRNYIEEYAAYIQKRSVTSQEGGTLVLRPIMPRVTQLLTRDRLRQLVVHALASKKEWPQLLEKELGTADIS